MQGFSSRYRVDRLVWFESCDDPITAIKREKQLKKWRRDWKVRLIEEQNPDWRDLYPVISANIFVIPGGGEAGSPEPMNTVLDK